MTTRLRSARFVATARKGIGSESKFPRAMRFPRSARLFVIAFASAVLAAERWRLKPCSPAPSRAVAAESRASAGHWARTSGRCRRAEAMCERIDLLARCSRLRRARRRLRPCSCRRRDQGGCRGCPSLSMTPMWASPFAPPPESTSAVPGSQLCARARGDRMRDGEHERRCSGRFAEGSSRQNL